MGRPAGRPGTEGFVPGHLLLPLSRDKGTTGQEKFFVPGQRDNGTSRPGLSRDVLRDVPSRGNPNFYPSESILEIHFAMRDPCILQYFAKMGSFRNFSSILIKHMINSYPALNCIMSGSVEQKQKLCNSRFCVKQEFSIEIGPPENSLGSYFSEVASYLYASAFSQNISYIFILFISNLSKMTGGMLMFPQKIFQPIVK